MKHVAKKRRKHNDNSEDDIRENYQKLIMQTQF